MIDASMGPPNAQPRVLFVDHVSRILGGAEINLIELLSPDSRSPAPWHVAVACDPAGRLHEALEPLGIHRYPFGLDSRLGTLRVVGRRFPLAGALRSLRALAKARRDLAGILDLFRPTIVVSCTNKDHFASGAACRTAGIPSVWWVNDIVSSDFFPWPARRAFQWQAARGASRLVPVSDFGRRALVAEGIPEAKIVPILNGIPLDRYRRTTDHPVRRHIGVPPDEPLIGILGRLTPWKGQRLFLDLAAAWCAKHEHGRFVVVGHAFNEDQAFERELHEIVRSRGLANRVHFLPFQRDIAAVLGDLDVLVHASIKPEPFGRVIIEAMAVGVPVIAAHAGGVPEIIDHGTDGLLARPGDAADYLDRLHDILGNPALRHRLASTGPVSVARRFSLDRVRADFGRIFGDLLGTTPRPPA